MQFVAKPNLPQTPVKLIAITSKEPALNQALKSLGIETVLVGPCPALHTPVEGHADLLLHHLGENQVLLAQNSSCEEDELLAHGFKLQKAQKVPGQMYPDDIALNTLQIGQFAFGKRSHTEPVLLHYLERTNVRFMDVRQGYARCSTCVIAENAMITADSGIQSAAEAVGIDCLKIPAGEVLLSGYAYGFLGGCCGLLAPNVLAVYGNVKKLSYCDTLSRFAANYGVTVMSLRKDIPPTDIGTIIPLLSE